MKENYKLELSSALLRTWNDGMLEKWNDGMASFGQITACGGFKLLIVNCQLLIVNEISTHGLLQDLNYIQKTKGGHGLHKVSSRVQTMTAFNQKFLRGGPGGAVFSKSAPLAAGGKHGFFRKGSR